MTFLECTLFRMCPLWNVLFLENAQNRMLPFLECALFGMCLFGKCSFWNVPLLESPFWNEFFFWNVLKTECALFGMCSFWNVPLLECALFGMCSFWNISFLECVLFTWNEMRPIIKKNHIILLVCNSKRNYLCTTPCRATTLTAIHLRNAFNPWRHS